MSVALTLAAAAPDLRASDLHALARDFAAAAPLHDREGSFPHANFAALHEAGLLALTVPRRFGGTGAGLAESAEAIGIVAEGCAATALVFAMQLLKHAAAARGGRWPAALHARIATDAVRHGALINALRVEPELGSPTRGGLPATVIRRAPDGGWVLDGHKLYCTGAPGLRWLDVWARTDEDAPRLGHVLVPADAPGVRIVETWDHLGMRASGSHDVVFEGVRLPEENAAELRPPASWRDADPEQAAWNAVALGALYTGVARAARDWVADFLRRRVPSGLGAPLATLPRMQEKVGEIEGLLAVNARLVDATAADTDRGAVPAPGEAALLKTALVENAIRAVEIAASLAGNHAHARGNAIERHLRDVLCARVHAPQADAAHLAAGRARLLEEGR
ncbi:acyl-CoA/acyl-ACP dehydrogenase [Roseomonas sp. NAR14]|uniref:Acyl-CoA/acyl-ACP dehydrogenase n=1 Tax=Roseomonas acroporae TaxID=2937791 RepID=A0A9X2BUQ5_9PROT|nr:acyl-CoA dehydrogenase family protein [Roseomonas acroporae]MCK8784391.1 acyl-CoA/acyl-ACP dehydrogenase [Roseomonas acroporae]